MSVLAQKNILVGVTGGIAAFKVPFLIRQLIKLNCNVKVVMTPSSKEFPTNAFPIKKESKSMHPPGVTPRCCI